MKIKIHISFLLFFVITTFQIAQEKKQLAQIGNIKITIDDFKKQFELSPMLYNTNSIEKKKEILLYSMIAEKLWAIEPENENIYKNPLMKYSLSAIKDKFTRDILYKEEVINRVSITPEELNEGISKYQTKLTAHVITTNSKNEIDSIYTLLNSGVPFDTLLISRPEFLEQVRPIEVEFGQMKERDEKILFNLSEGGFSQPIYTDVGWVIFYLVNKSINFENASKLLDEITSGTRSIIERRKINERYIQFNKEFLGGITVTADIELFKKFSELLWEKFKKLDIEGDKVKALSFYEIFNIKNLFSDNELQSLFIKFEKDPIKLIDFIGRLGFEGIKTKATNLKSFRNQLSGIIKNFIRLEIVTRIAKKRGYDNLPIVEEEFQIWKDNYNASLAMQPFTDSVVVSDNEIKNYFKQNRDLQISITKYKIKGLRTNSLDDVNNIITKLDEGQNFSTLIDNFESGNNTKINFNYEPIDKLGIIAEVITDVSIGEVYGPMREQNEFIIFQLLDTSEIAGNDSLLIKSEMKGIKQELYYKKLEDLIAKKTADLAEKYNISVDSELLQKINVNDLNIIVMRSFGFGEKMLAAPLIKNNYKWFEIFLKNKKDLP